MISEEKLDTNQALYRTYGCIHNINERVTRLNKSNINKTNSKINHTK